MPYNILLLPLIGGFLFIHIWNRTKFKAIRLDKERLLFYAALAGIFLLGLAYVLKALIPPFIPCVSWFPCLPSMPFEYLGLSSTALVLGLVLGYPLNLIWKEDNESSRYIEEEGDPFEQLINGALDTTTPVMLTLKGGKVYVGFVVSSFTPNREQRTIHIAPLRSGYREDQKHRVSFTTDYAEALQKIPADVEKLKASKREAEENYKQLEETHASQEKTRASLIDGGDKNKQALAKLDGEITTSTAQLAHLRTVIDAYADEIKELETALADFGIVIQIDEIVTSTLYHARIHAEYFSHKDPE